VKDCHNILTLWGVPVGEDPAVEEAAEARAVGAALEVPALEADLAVEEVAGVAAVAMAVEAQVVQRLVEPLALHPAWRAFAGPCCETPLPWRRESAGSKLSIDLRGLGDRPIACQLGPKNLEE
jgi:hypothetical protein